MMLADDFNASETKPDTSEQAVEVRHSIVMQLLSNVRPDWLPSSADGVIEWAGVLCAFVLRGEMSGVETYKTNASDVPVRYASVTVGHCDKCGDTAAVNNMVMAGGLRVCHQCAGPENAAESVKLQQALADAALGAGAAMQGKAPNYAGDVAYVMRCKLPDIKAVNLTPLDDEKAEGTD